MLILQQSFHTKGLSQVLRVLSKMKISQMIGSVAIATSIVTVAAIVSPMSVKAASFTFGNIAGGDTVGDSLAQYLSMDVTSSGSGVLFKFNNAAGNTATTSFIGTVYIDAAPALLGSNITVNSGNVGNVDFGGGIGTKNLPQSEHLATAFTTNYDFTKDGGASNGVQKSESLGVLFSNANFTNVINAINGGSLRVGYHLQGITPPNPLTGSTSDSYVNNPNTPTPTKPVPVPGLLLGVMAAGALGGKRLLKSKKQAV